MHPVWMQRQVWVEPIGCLQPYTENHINLDITPWVVIQLFIFYQILFIHESTGSQLPIPWIGNFWRSRLRQQFLYGRSIQECKSGRERQLQFLPLTTSHQYQM